MEGYNIYPFRNRNIQRENERLFKTIIGIKSKPQFTYLNSINSSPRSRILNAGFTIKTPVVREGKPKYLREKSFASILEKDQKSNGPHKGGHSFSKTRQQRFFIESENARILKALQEKKPVVDYDKIQRKTFMYDSIAQNLRRVSEIRRSQNS